MTVFLIFLHILSAWLFSMCYKISPVRGLHLGRVQAMMHISSGLLMVPIAAALGVLWVDWRIFLLGSISGLVLVLGVRAFFIAMRQGGLAIGWTCVNMAVVIPVLSSILFWSEIPSPWQWLGLTLLVPAIVLFRDLKLQVSGNRRRWALLVAVASVATGVYQVMNKYAAQMRTDFDLDLSELQMAMSYLLWGLLSGGVAMLLLKRRDLLRCGRGELLVGPFMGILQVLMVGSLIVVLADVEGIVMFPLKAAAGLMLTAVSAVLIWGERLTWHHVVGIVLGGASIALVNLR
jgi:drug/metabolite transporter (DMT)-like permease